MAEKVTNDYATVSDDPLLISGLELTVADPPPTELLGGNFRIRIEDPDIDGNPSGNNVEFLNVTLVDPAGTTWTVVREAENPARFPAVSHAGGSIVTHVFTAAALAEIVGVGGGGGGGEPATLVVLGSLTGAETLATDGDAAIVARGAVLVGDTQLTVTGLVSAQVQNIAITGKQDATGGRTLSINDGSGAVSVPVPTDSNEPFQINALWDGTDFWVDLVGGGAGGGGVAVGGVGVRFEQDTPALTTSRAYHLTNATEFSQAWITVDTPVVSDVNLVDVLINGATVETLPLTADESTALIPISVVGDEGDILVVSRLSLDGDGLVVELLQSA